MTDDLNAWIATALTAEAEAGPGRVVVQVALYEDPIRIGGANEIVYSCRRARDVELLPFGGLVILINPTDADSLVGCRCGAVKVDPVGCP